MVPKPRFGFFVFVGKCYPGLHTVQDGFFTELVVRCAFGVDNASPCRHPVHRAGTDFLNAADTIAVEQNPFKQVGTVAKLMCGCGPTSRDCQCRQQNVIGSIN
jgi:hypothetical protein